MKKSFKLSEYLEFMEPKYIYLKIVPSTSIRNYNSDNILKVIASLYRNLSQRVKIINKKFIFESPAKVSFYIYMEKSKVEFYFIVPEKHYSLFKDKITDTWNNKVTISIVTNIPLFNHDSTKFYLDYKNNDAMSLVTDKRNNSLLASELSTLYVMEEGDSAGVFFNFIPLSQSSWIAEYENAMKRVYSNGIITKSRFNLWSIFCWLLNGFIVALDIALSSINLGNPQTKSNHDYFITDETKNKKNYTIIGTQIVCMSKSNDKLREYNTAQSLCNTFQALTSQNNELISRRIWKKNIDLMSVEIPNIPIMKVSPREGQNFISLPAKELLEEHKIIEHIKIRKELPPKELLNGIIPLGNFTYDNNDTITTYMPNTKTQKNLPFAVVGANRTGKSSLLANIAHYAQKGGECTIFFDFCGNCSISDDIKMVCNNVFTVDCSDEKSLQGMGYNEMRTDDTNTFRHYDNVKGQASQLIALVNSINDSDRDLKTKMNKFLRAAALIVFINNGSFKDVFEVLQDCKLRHKYISNIKPQYLPMMNKHITVLSELDDTKGGEVIGSKMNPAIYGIMDRIDSLQANTYMELMFEKDTKYNFNLIDEIQKPQIICFRMPERMFKTKSEKDTYCTYWMSKIWFALKLRQSYYDEKELVKVNIIIDELYQVERCEEFVREILSQLPKFNARIILSCHHINQLTSVKDELLNANGSYILISGCSKQNYYALKEEMYPYELEDLMNLKKFTSLNVIKLEDGYYSFVTSLPKPLNPKHVL